MELRHLEYFVAVVDESSFTRAAARLHVAQPGVSAQLRRLEAELGEPLLDRSGRGVRTTDVGDAVLPHARAALAAAARVREVVQERTGLLGGRVTLGAVATILSSGIGLPELLSEFHADHPGVDVSLRELGSEPLLDKLRSGELDVAIAGVGDISLAGIEVHPITDDTLVAAVAHDHPLAKRRSIALRDLAGQTLICLPPGTSLRETVERGFAQAGVAAEIAFEVSDPIGTAELAAQGLGVAILPEPVALARADRIHTLRLAGPRLRGSLALCWATGGPASPAARAVLAAARERLHAPG